MSTLKDDFVKIVEGNYEFGLPAEEVADDILWTVVARIPLVARRLCRDDNCDWDRISLTQAGEYMSRATAYVGALLEEDGPAAPAVDPAAADGGRDAS